MKKSFLNPSGTYMIILFLIFQNGCNQDRQQDIDKAISEFKYDTEIMANSRPWSKEDFKDNPDNFQFATIGDRTGGANVQGTFALAMDQLNLLQPEFVINVGDIIEGYSEDNPRPEPPPEIRETTKVYKKLQTEDPEAAKKMLAEFMKSEAIVAAFGKPVEFPEKQMDWITKTLEENVDVRWTFLFMHEPCWENPSESFKLIEELLMTRDYTFFAGHLHYYDYDNINDREYITIGPTGASWHHDGPGNVDHVMWVTMIDEGPEMANIALKGIFDRKGLDPSLFGAYDRKGAN